MKEPDEHSRPEGPLEPTPDAPDQVAPPRPAKHSEALEVELAALEALVAEPPAKAAAERPDTANPE
jgi:hypothetical protein